MQRARLHGAAAALLAGSDQATVLRHRIAATPGEDPALAHDLLAFAEREAATGAWPSAAAHLVEAGRVGGDPSARNRLLLRAVHLLLISGDVARAVAFDEEIARLPRGPLRDSVRGHLAIVTGDPVAARQLPRAGVGRLRSTCGTRARGDDRGAARGAPTPGSTGPPPSPGPAGPSS